VLLEAAVKMWQLPKFIPHKLLPERLQAVIVSQYTEQLTFVTSQSEMLPRAILMLFKDTPGACTEIRQHLDIQICAHVLQIQIANSRSSTTAPVKKVCRVLIGNHRASGTQSVRFVWQSH